MSSSATSITMPLRGFFGVLARCCNTRIPTSASPYSSGAWRVQQVGVYLRHPDASAYSCLSGSPALPRSHLAASSGSLAAFSLFLRGLLCVSPCVCIYRQGCGSVHARVFLTCSGHVVVTCIQGDWLLMHAAWSFNLFNFSVCRLGGIAATARIRMNTFIRPASPCRRTWQKCIVHLAALGVHVDQCIADDHAGRGLAAAARSYSICRLVHRNGIQDGGLRWFSVELVVVGEVDEAGRNGDD
jgi:hypothetical protein